MMRAWKGLRSPPTASCPLWPSRTIVGAVGSERQSTIALPARAGSRLVARHGSIPRPRSGQSRSGGLPVADPGSPTARRTSSAPRFARVRVVVVGSSVDAYSSWRAPSTSPGVRLSSSCVPCGASIPPSS